MKGLLLKDFYNLSRLGKQYLLILAGMSVWAYFMKSPSYISMYVVLCSSMLVLTSFSYDEYAKFDKYALTMPIAKKTLVQEKFVLLLLSVVGGMVIGVLLGGLMCLLVGGDFMETAVTGITVGFVFLISYSAIFPAIFKAGVEKARIMLVGVYLIIFALIFASVRLFGGMKILNGNSFLDWLIPVAALIIAAIVAMIAYFMSLQIVEKKEW